MREKLSAERLANKTAETRINRDGDSRPEGQGITQSDDSQSKGRRITQDSNSQLERQQAMRDNVSQAGRRQVIQNNDRELERQQISLVSDNKLKDHLITALSILPSPRKEKLEETIHLCTAEMHRQAALYEERTGFWGYLSDIFRFEGMSIFGLQVIALLVSCLGIATVARLPEMIPAFMPLFGLALVPVLYRNQAYGMCEVEAATRASGAQIVLAKLILAGAANLLCMTAVLCLEVSVSGASDQIVELILYSIVPFLVCMAELLRRIRMCRRGNIMTCTMISLASCAGWGMSARAFPWLYEASAAGVWAIGFVVFAAFFIREICYIMQMRKEGKMYGIID